jgi:hypothetical protein
MRILIVITKTPGYKLLVKLQTEGLVNDIMCLLSKRRHEEAMALALTKGLFEGELERENSGHASADMILYRDRACWSVDRTAE